METGHHHAECQGDNVPLHIHAQHGVESGPKWALHNHDEVGVAEEEELPKLSDFSLLIRKQNARPIQLHDGLQ